MARTKEITAEALGQLGPERLAELLAEACEGDQALRRKVSLLLASNEGGDKLEKAIAKRIGALARARGFVDWRKAPTLAAELAALREGIATELATKNPQAAIEQLWRLLDTAETTIERADDSSGRIGDEFYWVADELGGLLGRVTGPDQLALVERLHASLAEDEYGFAARLVASAADGLGPAARATLAALLKADLARLPAHADDESWTGIGWPRARLSRHLAVLADAEDDVDAFIGAIELGGREAIDGAEVAERLIAAGRAEEALAWLDRDRRARGPLDLTIADLRIAGLEALGNGTKAQALRWQAFELTLSARHLREYLRRLPDFEDFEVERSAIAHAAVFPDPVSALGFLVEWPAFDAADALVRRRIAELDGRHYGPLGAAAERLGDDWPVAATLLYRALVSSVLDRGASKAYAHAARDLASARRVAERLPAEADIADHEAFLAELKAKHGRKYGFWTVVKEAGGAG